MILIVFLIVLLLGGTGGWYWTGRPDYAGPPVNGVLGLLLLLVLVLLVVRLAGVL